jgi:uncharacterized membrane protein YqgA involved in biofilm formation
MGGTLLNTVTIIIGSLAGMVIGSRLTKQMQESIMMGLGLVVAYLGISNAATTQNIIVPLISLVIGVIIGELLRIEDHFENFGGWLQARLVGNNPSAEAESLDANGMDARQRFITGFVMASLVYSIGPLALLGSIQDGMGLSAGFEQLAIKATIDGFASVAFAATFGIGVLASAGTIFVFQGSLALLGSLIGAFMTEPMVAEMVATGGIMLMGMSVKMLDIKPIRLANFLPALVVAPILVTLMVAFGWY